jgi:hypothetical protein
MTVSTTSSKHIYSGDLSNRNWSYTFPITNPQDIVVHLVNTNGSISRITSNFSVDEINSRVVYPTVASGLDPINGSQKIILTRGVPQTQEVELSNSGFTNLEVFEIAYDKLTLLIQDLAEKISRAVKFPLNQTPSEEETEDFMFQIDTAVEQAQSAQAAAEQAVADAEAIRDEMAEQSGGFSQVYTYIVGSGHYDSLQDLIADHPLNESRVYIAVDQFLESPITLSYTNCMLEFSPDATVIDNGAGTGLILDGSGIRIRGGRFSGFTTAIQINDTKKNNFITECRFLGCTTDVDDQNVAPNNVIFGNLTE